MVDTNVLMSHLSLVERAFDNLMGAALEARWACACVCGVAWRGLDLQGKPLGSRCAWQRSSWSNRGRSGLLTRCWPPRCPPPLPRALLQQGGAACSGGAAAGALGGAE